MKNKLIKTILVIFFLIGLPLCAVEQESTEKTQYTIENIYLEWDPYTGDYIDQYKFLLDDGNVWVIHWFDYEHSSLSWHVGDVVELPSIGHYR